MDFYRGKLVSPGFLIEVNPIEYRTVIEKTFRTEVNPEPFPFCVDYSTPTLLLGSCFTENIGELMTQRKLPVQVNPQGVVYNPESVALVLQRVMDGKPYTSADLLHRSGLWLSLEHHTSFSDVNQQSCLDRINKSLEASHSFWQKAQRLVITFGTARVYSYNQTGLTAANCHKIPAKEFTHSLLNVDRIVARWSGLLTSIFKSRPDIKVVFTVSPIRHWKDGAVGNQVSKATLILAVNQLVNLFPGAVFYFPSYEILMDDLRDYRFYTDDMLHPTPFAVNYIWEKFKGCAMSSNTLKALEEVERIVQAMNHRPFNPKTAEHKKFLEATRKRILSLSIQYPDIPFDDELIRIDESIKNF